MRIIDSWFAGASSMRRIQYRIVFREDYCLEYSADEREWVKVEEENPNHRVAKGIAFLVIAEDLRQGKKERRLA